MIPLPDLCCHKFHQSIINSQSFLIFLINIDCHPFVSKAAVQPYES